MKTSRCYATLVGRTTLVGLVLAFGAILPISAQNSPSGAEPASPKVTTSPKVPASPQVTTGPQPPSNAQLLLPNVVLQVPDIAAASVNPPLPAGQPLSVPDAGVPLPDQGDLHVPDQAFDIPLTGGQSESPVQRQGSTLYNTGVLGVGTANHILGSLSLYKLGESPRLRLHFLHEGMDGFAGRKAGTGYFSSTNNLGGWISTGAQKVSTETEASFQQQELGLQNQSSFYSVGLRSINGYTGLTFKPGSTLSLGARIEADGTSRLFSVASPSGGSNPEQWAYEVAPSLTAGLSLQGVTLTMRGGYKLRLTDGLAPFNSADLSLAADASLPADFALKAEAGAFWNIGSGFEYPFSIELGKSFGTDVVIRLGGGYRITPLSFGQLWMQYPLLHVGDVQNNSLLNESAWYGRLGYSWSTPDLLFTTEGSVELAFREHVVNITGYNQSSSNYQYSQQNMVTLMPRFQLRWSPTSLLSLGVGLKGMLLDRAVQEPFAAITANLSLTGPRNRIGGGLSGSFNLFNTPEAPNVSANVFFRITDGVELDLDAQDLLAPLLPNGRPVLGPVVNSNFPFITPGFRVTLTTHISL